MNRIVLTVFGMVTTLVGTGAIAADAGTTTAGDAAAGKAKSGICIACHGPTGISPQEIWPNLASQRYGYLVKTLTAFRDGTRKDPIMEPMAKGLTDQDIRNLAAYYSQQPATATAARK